MAKREISSTLRNLKFMQRSALKEEKKKKKIDDDNANFTPSPGSVSKNCVVITDWDPQPRAFLGRLSFQSFNPSIEKLNEEESITGGKTDASPTGSSGNGGRMSFRTCHLREATMAKREISSTLRNLKFMQRSALKEEKKKNKIDDDDDDNANFTPSPGSVSKKCVVITDWDPQPRALLGRLSFQSFNPSIEKLNEEESITGGKTDASPTGSSGNGGRMSFRKMRYAFHS
ncbi:hypothetical protein F2Q69_00044189 [Brassica cretica]|uniref:Uncharacterized protein n=1 Tax=Brassica cretica TaxID=69181 RepID=A0A8S9NDZ0_BRACR|nr:hypothetical protein F2Q69_00044189 [Brassica cretica]